MVASIEHGSVDLRRGTDAVLSYLPLAHVAERIMYFATFCYGGRIGIFTTKDKKLLPAACQVVKPTLFLSVPRLYNKFYAVFQAKLGAQTGCIKCLLDKGIKKKGDNI